MITHEEIKNLVVEWKIREDVIEKDYVIGWLLWGIGQDKDLKDKWVFKGGTSLKKCYLETYRFSEDLDFTVLPDAPLKPQDIQPILERILDRVYEESGIDFSVKPILLKQKNFPLYTEGRIYYQGPRRAHNPARIKLDLSASEKVVSQPIARTITHSYSDKLPEPAKVLCYSLEEVFAEKIRAMGERGYPRDLYDIIFLFRNGPFKENPELIKSILVSKCESKNVPLPSNEIFKQPQLLNELKTEWGNMLGHQLPKLPNFEEFLDELPELFNWLEKRFIPKPLKTIPGREGEKIGWHPPAGIRRWGFNIPLESIRFAAVNHLCIELGYHRTNRIIEPYSLRRTTEGNLLLYAVKVNNNEIRAYRVDRIESVKVTDNTFQPRFQIEFSPSGNIDAPPTERKIIKYKQPLLKKDHKTFGPTYIFECSVCGKRFKRSKYDSTLKPHKDKNGYMCIGRYGNYVETKY
jgi:predicted nucleotidyltransferase component of viral defense system